MIWQRKKEVHIFRESFMYRNRNYKFRTVISESLISCRSRTARELQLNPVGVGQLGNCSLKTYKLEIVNDFVSRDFTTLTM